MNGERNGDSGANPGDSILAGEYVLGVLDSVQRRAVEHRMAADPAFAEAVEDWRLKLAPMDNAYAPATPPPDAFAAIERRLFPQQPCTQPSRVGSAWSGLPLWRGLALSSLAALAVLLWIGFRAPMSEVAHGQRLVAALAADGSPVRLIALYDPTDAKLTLSTLSGEPGSGSDFELWLIAGGGAPVSLGVLPHGETIAVPVAADRRPLLGSGVTLAVSREPAGGSPTGAPTGPVVAAGTVRAM